MKKTICMELVLCLLALCGLAGCGEKELKATDTQFLLNTFITLTAECGDEELDAAFELCREYESKLSRTEENSEISRLNSSGKAEVSDDTLELLERSLYYSRLTNGRFDTTVCPVSSLWDFNSNAIPERREIAEALKSVDYQNIEVSGNTVDLGGSKLDLGAIAKGYIADRLLEYFKEAGVKSGIINLGGNVLAFGDKEYNIGIKKPFSEDEIALTLKVSNTSVVTSGIYERYIEKDNKIYHHILDPKTGYPVSTDLISATVVCESSVDADALATCCMLLGRTAAENLIEKTEGAEAVFIAADGRSYITSGLARGDGYIKLRKQ